MRICRDIGCTIGELRHRMTEEELLLWNVLYAIEHEEAQEAAKKRK
jgi:hypothetical protein